MNLSQGVGLVGTGLVIVGYVPQIHHLIKERRTAGLSMPAFAVWSLASLLFLIHAVLIRDVVFIGRDSRRSPKCYGSPRTGAFRSGGSGSDVVPQSRLHRAS